MIFIFLFLYAGISGANNLNEKQEEKKSIEPVLHTEQTLSGVHTRLRVEGAQFRAFNLYFAPTQFSEQLTKKQKNLVSKIRNIIERDLAIVGGFNFVIYAEGDSKENHDAVIKQKGAEGISRLSIGYVKDIISAKIEHKNLITNKTSIKNFSTHQKELRKLSHLLSQSIYEEFIGPENIFLLQLAAVKQIGANRQLVLLDFDGENETQITEGLWSKASPYFSPDGKNILYTVISSKGQGIVEQEIGKKHFRFVIRKPGLNLDPRVFLDNSSMLVTLSFENVANIYKITRQGLNPVKLTRSVGMNLSPTISPDGKEFAFVSERSGSPQIYVQSFSSGEAVRLTMKGLYNQTPHFNPKDANVIAFTGRDEHKVFDIFLIERSSGRVSRVTQHQGWNQEPHFSPSGRFIIFVSKRDGKEKSDIFISSLNGNHQYRLTNADGDKNCSGYFSPIIRPQVAQ